MRKLWIGITVGIALGLFDVLMIMPMSIPNKELVLLGAFSNRFSIGLFSATVVFGFPFWLQGIVVGFILSVLPAVSNPSFAPMILGLGTFGGLLTGLVTQHFTKKKGKK
jgi:hypothetical protein